MDPELYEMMDKHMAKHRLTVDSFSDMEIPEIKVDYDKVDYEKLF